MGSELGLGLGRGLGLALGLTLTLTLAQALTKPYGVVPGDASILQRLDPQITTHGLCTHLVRVRARVRGS